MKTSKEDQILNAAEKVFAKFGFEKATMNDIAREAGVARQTVYNAFDSKDAVFIAYVRRRLDRLRAELEKAWAQDTDFESFLDTFLRLVPIAWFDETSAVADPAALIDRLHRVADEELQRFASETISSIAARLTPYDLFDNAAGLTRTAFAEGLYWSAVNAKYNAPTRDAFLSRIETTRMMALKVLGAE